MSNVRYFSHDRDALSDSKIEDMRSEYGMEGYGVYWALLEAMCMEPDLSLPYSDRKAKVLQTKLATSFDMKQFIDDCISYKLFETDKKRFWSASLRGRLSSVVDLSNKRRKAAQARWDKVKEQKPKVEEDYATELDDSLKGIDPEWKRVMDEYQRQIGALPMGNAFDKLLSYFDDLGADPMIVAIQKTNKDQATVPYPYLAKILESFVQAGVKTKEQAEANVNDFERNRNGWRQSSNQEQPSESKEEVRWF